MSKNMSVLLKEHPAHVSAYISGHWSCQALLSYIRAHISILFIVFVAGLFIASLRIIFIDCGHY